MLMQAQFVLGGGRLPRKSKGIDLERRRAATRARVARYREQKLKPNGICTSCGVNPAAIRQDGKQGVKCYYCGAEANTYRTQERSAAQAKTA